MRSTATKFTFSVYLDTIYLKVYSCWGDYGAGVKEGFELAEELRSSDIRRDLNELRSSRVQIFEEI
jgi:hypothetical protein